jgi:MFS family permease
MGTNVAVGAIILMPMIVLGGYFADRFSKISIYLFCLCVTLALNIAYYLFVVLGLHNHRPSLWEIIVFGEMIAMCSTLANIVQWPLIFEYIPRTKMGTASAGMEMVSSIFGLVLGPLVGLWVLGYSQLFTPPAGFACHLEFSRPVTMAHLQVELAKSKSDSIRRLVIEPEENADSFQGRRWILFLIDNGDEVAADEQKGEEPSSAPHAKEAARENDLVSEAFRTTSDLDLNSVHTIFRPKQYDYFSAYLLTILGGILAIVIIFVVLSFEKRGIIKKLGVIEAADRPHEQSPVGH